MAKNKTAAKNKTSIAPIATIALDGFTVKFETGLPENVKAATSRATTNVWYAIAEWLADGTAGFITITRDQDSKAKSPMSNIDRAITRCRKMKVQNYGKLDCVQSNDKGVWFFIRYA